MKTLAYLGLVALCALSRGLTLNAADANDPPPNGRGAAARLASVTVANDRRFLEDELTFSRTTAGVLAAFLPDTEETRRDLRDIGLAIRAIEDFIRTRTPSLARGAPLNELERAYVETLASSTLEWFRRANR